MRFTPTGVGTTICEAFFISLSTVHPHGRGDNSPAPINSPGQPGSPPRAWGQLPLSLSDRIFNRFTPTGVGTTVTTTNDPAQATVHPHGRGDNASVWRACPGVAGSPPRAWGQRYGCDDDLGAIRFTPTGVGTTV